jgi:pre-rRNA-processing protein TSR3
MRSSASTPNRPRRTEVPLLIVFADEDDPRRCSGRRLLRSGDAAEVDASRPAPGDAVILDPHATTPLSLADRPAALRSGLLAVDCSWNRVGQTGAYPREIPWIRRLRHRRRLPWLLAGNPQHFGRLAELNTAEALAASLVVLGEADRGRRLLAVFPGGPSFFELNAVPLRAYQVATTPEGILRGESAGFGSPS